MPPALCAAAVGQHEIAEIAGPEAFLVEELRNEQAADDIHLQRHGTGIRDGDIPGLQANVGEGRGGVQRQVDGFAVVGNLEAGKRHARPRMVLDRAIPRSEARRAVQDAAGFLVELGQERSEEHTSELPSLMRISYAVFCLKKKKK